MILTATTVMNVTAVMATAVFKATELPSTIPPVDPQNFHERLKLIVLVPITCIIMFSNATVLLYILCNKQLHKPAYLFIASLSIADLFVGCVSVGTIVRPNDSILELCLVRMGFVTSACVSSIYCMMWIAIDRYVAIMYPFKYTLKMSYSRALCGVVSIWSVSFLIGFAPLMGWNVGQYHQYCSVMYIMSPSYIIFLFVAGFLTPMTFIVVTYCLLFRKAKRVRKRMQIIDNIVRQNRNNRNSTNNNKNNGRRLSHNSEMSRRNWRSARVVIILIGCFVVTWFPFMVVSLVQILCGDDTCHLKDIIGSYLLLLGFTNSFLNPIIYAVSNKEFKSFFAKSFSNCCKTRIRPFFSR